MTKTRYKVTYAGTRKAHFYSTLKAAREQARWAVGIGNTKSCIKRQLPSGRWELVECKIRRRAGKYVTRRAKG